jgi:hypothetical protein
VPTQWAGSRAGLAQGGSDPWHQRAALGLAVLLAAHALLTTSYGQQIAQIFSSGGATYAERRLKLGFARIPVDRIVERLNAVLPLSTPIALAPGLQEGFTRLGLTEALYPRPIDDSAPNTLDLSDPSLVTGPLPEPPLQAPFAESFELDPLAFLGSLLAALGIGLAPLAWVTRRWPIAAELWPGLAILLGASGIALCASLATMLQVPLPWRALSALGVALLGASLWFVWRRHAIRAGLAAAFAAALRRPEVVVPAGLLALFFVRMLFFPIVLWDGRAIWLFAAKRISTHGMYALADLTSENAAWSHTAYPILFPAWLAHFTALSAHYNERLASLGVPVLYCALLALVWTLTRSTIGRWPGAALTLAAFLGTARLVSGGYADAHLMLLLCIEVLALFGASHPFVGYAAALAASLLKVEGAIFAASVMGAAAILAPRNKKRAFWSRAAPFAVFAPAVTYRIWTRAVGVPDPNSEIDWSMGWNAAASRIEIVLAQAPRILLFDAQGDYLQIHAFLRAAVLALPCTLAAWLLVRRTASARELRVAGSILAVALLLALVAAAGIVSAPFDTAWLVAMTLDRLLLPTALLLLLTPFLLLRASGSGRDDR